MATNGFQERWGRETRLLLLVVAVSIALLLLLARFRFPAAALKVAAPPPSPLSGLAGRADFEDLANTMSTLLGRVSPRLSVVQLEPAREPAAASKGARPETARSGRAGQEPDAPAPALVVGLHVRQGLALVPVPAGLVPASLVGSAGPIEVVATDLKRSVALVRIPSTTEFRPEPLTDTFLGFEYIGEIEATRNGPSVQPVFIGRADPVVDDRWPMVVFTLGNGSGLSAGRFIFSVTGRFIGLVQRDEQGARLVPASALDAVVTELGAAGAIAP